MNFQTGEGTRLKRQRAEQAIQLALQSRWEEAAAINRAIISVFPSDVDAYNRLGKALMEMGENEDARRAYEKALELDPGNSIARRNLQCLDVRKSLAATRGEGSRHIDPALFIAQTGKTGIATLRGVAGEMRAGLTAGDSLNLRAQGNTVAVETAGGEPLGEIEPKMGLRLSRLIEGGNRYVAAIASLSDGGVRVIIREVYQHPSQQGRPSFPAAGDTYRPYVKERLVRHDGDEEESPEELDEGEDWEQETVATEGDIPLQDYQEATEGEVEEEELEE
jgi:tetratricopeptide (TPR) repeat protein